MKNKIRKELLADGYAICKRTCLGYAPQVLKKRHYAIFPHKSDAEKHKDSDKKIIKIQIYGVFDEKEN